MESRSYEQLYFFICLYIVFVVILYAFKNELQPFYRYFSLIVLTSIFGILCYLVLPSADEKLRVFAGILLPMFFTLVVHIMAKLYEYTFPRDPPQPAAGVWILAIAET